MLERLDPAADVWLAAAPLSFLGLRIGTRMTVVRLASGDLWVHSPIALTPELRAAVDALGPRSATRASSLATIASSCAIRASRGSSTTTHGVPEPPPHGKTIWQPARRTISHSGQWTHQARVRPRAVNGYWRSDTWHRAAVRHSQLVGG
jgi:Domain of unknown function (DUF4336)